MTSDDGPYRGEAPSAPPPQYAAPGYGPTAGYYPPAAYPPPGYGPPPGCGPPPGYPPPGHGHPSYRRPTNTLAVLALVMAFVFAPAGLVLGIVARRQIRQTGEEGDGLALAGIIVGGLITAFFVVMILFMIIAFAGMSSYSTD